MLTTVLDAVAAALLVACAGLIVGVTIDPLAGFGAACGVAGLLLGWISWRLNREGTR